MYHIVILQPNQALKKSSELLEKMLPKSTITYCRTTRQLKIYLATTTPDLVCVSTALPSIKILHILETVKNHAKKTRHLPSLLYLIDWEQPLHHLLGTQWGGQVGVLHAQMNQTEIRALLKRVRVADRSPHP